MNPKTVAQGIGTLVFCMTIGCNPAAHDGKKTAKPAVAEEIAAPPASATTAAAERHETDESDSRRNNSPARTNSVQSAVQKKRKQQKERTVSEGPSRQKPQNRGEPPPLIARSVLFGNPDRTAARISPNGQRLAFLAPVDGVLNVWVCSIDKPASARPVTHDKLRGIRTYHWAYTNEHIVYLQDVGGDENWHVYLVDLPSSETTDLTPLEQVNAQISGMSHRVPGEMIVSLNDRNPNVHDLYRIELDSRRREMVEKNTENFTGYVLDDDLRVRFASRMLPDGSSELVRKEDKTWAKFLTVPQEDTLTTQPVGFDKSGDVLYLIDSRHRDTGALTAWDLESGEQKLLAEDKHADVAELLVHPTENTIDAVSFNYLRKQW
ncbi:MAG: TolB family protein, partial [Pirellulales bacterium]